MEANLAKVATPTSMRTLAGVDRATATLESLDTAHAVPEGTEVVEIEVPEASGGLEAARPKKKKIKVLVSKPESFAGRDGYQSSFISGWKIPLPVPQGDLEHDIQKLKDGHGSVLKYEHFSTVQSKSRRMPMFVGVNINGKEERRITRTSTPWRFDGRLEIAQQIGDEVYSDKNNVLDRGHMVRREDPNWGTLPTANRANDDTFHFTNACPQMAEVNQHIWLGLENYILRNTRNEDLRVTVFTGPVFTKNDFPFRGAFVPKSFWKVVAVVDENGRPSATAYEVSQEVELSALEFVFGPYETFQVSISSIEQKTSLSFGDLARFDGFSASEHRGGGRRRTRLESLEMVQI